MPGLDPTQVRVGITGALLIAPIGTTPPANTSGAWPAGWVDLGYADDAGPPATIAPNQTTKNFKGWQAYLPIRTVATDRSMQWMFKLVQKSGTILKASMGGGTIVSLGGGDFKYTLPSPSFVDEHAFGLEVRDGAIIDRFIMPRGLIVTTSPIVFRKDEMVKFDLTISALAPAGSPDGSWDLLVSNDPAMSA